MASRPLDHRKMSRNQFQRKHGLADSLDVDIASRTARKGVLKQTMCAPLKQKPKNSAQYIWVDKLTWDFPISENVFIFTLYFFLLALF